jgi:crossover junction endodeoxyribonuclease RusA
MTQAPELIPAPEGFTIDLPWPPKELSPNARVHWRKRHKHAKAYRLACGLITKAARNEAPDGKLYFWVTFFPPNRRKLDDDNLIGRFKAGRDGVADGLGIDDARFMTTVNIGDPVPGGSVRVHIRGQIQG